jgi:hypothetical protein
MLLIRCTEKLAKEMGLKRRDLSDPAQAGFLGSRFGHVFRIERRKCLIFTNDETLYSFVVAGVRRSQLADLGRVFANHLLESLRVEGLETLLRERIGDGSKHVVLARTNNRSVVGSMNDLRFMAEVDVETSGGLGEFDVGRVSYRLNRTPMSALNYELPLRAFRRKLGLTST